MSLSRALMPLLAAAVFLAGPAAGRIAERIVAKVNRDIITLTEWEDMVEATLVSSGAAPQAEEKMRIAEQVLDRMITDRLIIQAGKALGLKATESDVAPHVDREIEAVRSRFPDQKEFTAQLKREGMTLADLRRRYSEQIKERFVYLQMVNRKKRELEMKIEIPPSRIEEYYAANRDREEWRMPARVRARHIQFSIRQDLHGEARENALAQARERLKAAQAAIKRGEDFGEVAQTFSDDATTREVGGDLGVFAKGTYHSSLENAAFRLKAGKVSGTVESPVGLHLIQTTEVLPERPRELEETLHVPPPPGSPESAAGEDVLLREYIRRILLNERLSEAFQEWVASLRDAALIERFLEAPAEKDETGNS